MSIRGPSLLSAEAHISWPGLLGLLSSSPAGLSCLVSPAAHSSLSPSAGRCSCSRLPPAQLLACVSLLCAGPASWAQAAVAHAPFSRPLLGAPPLICSPTPTTSKPELDVLRHWSQCVVILCVLGCLLSKQLLILGEDLCELSVSPAPSEISGA